MKTKIFDVHEALVKELIKSYESMKKYNYHSQLTFNYNSEIKADRLNSLLQKTDVVYEITTDSNNTVVAVELINRTNINLKSRTYEK